MATVFDLSLFQTFDAVYAILLVFAIVYALLSKTKGISDNMAINALIAVVASFMVLLSQTLIDIINFMVPWFVVTIIFLVLMVLLFQLFGASDKDLVSAMKDKALMWTIIGIGLVIMVAAFASVLGQQLTEQSFNPGSTVVNASGGVATSDFQTNIYATLFNPKVLGLLIIFGVAIFAVALISY